MELFIGKQLQTVVYSFVLGLIFGGLYDIIRITHILCGIASYTASDEEKRPEKRGFVSFLLFFLGDAAYMLTVTAIFSVFQYWQMSGKFRLFVLLSVLAGYAVWHRTAGRLVMAFSEAIVHFLRRIVLWTVVKPVRLLLRILRKSAGFLYRHTAGRAAELLCRGIRSLCMRNIRRKFRKDIVLQGK